MITTGNAELAERARLLCNHGAKPKYYHSLVGTNSRLDALQAAILRVKLKHLDRWSEKRAKNATLYNALFEGSKVGRPYHDARTRHIYNQYVIRVPKRDELKKHLTEKNIGCEIYYPVPLHLQKCFAHLGYKSGGHAALGAGRERDDRAAHLPRSCPKSRSVTWPRPSGSSSTRLETLHPGRPAPRPVRLRRARTPETGSPAAGST
jgi:dTDP-4-amino-4,6-dideoxygalactose transaminase